MKNSVGLISEHFTSGSSQKDPAAWIGSAAFWPPQHIVESGWLEHAPFAFWLIDTIRPSTLVELGTHNGFSYFSFCQAVQWLRLSTACYAVDNWLGDEHAGFYGEEVYARVAGVNDQRYSGFSRLLRCRFDEALDYFGDGVIDLLHLDGRHYFDDVLHEFETWRPKLSSRGVVLIHDINEREREFGVWRLWAELSTQHPSFSFLHGHGLGVLAVGPDIAVGLRPLLEAGADQTDLIRTAYARLGLAVRRQYELELTHRILAETAAARDEYERAFREADSSIQMLKKRLDDIEKVRADLLASLDSQRTAGNEQARAVADLRDALARETDVAQAARATANEQARAVADLRNALARETNIAQAARAHAERIEQSSFWQATRPFRAILGRTSPSVRLTLRRGAKALWWAMTPHRIPARIQFLRARALQQVALDQMPGETRVWLRRFARDRASATGGPQPSGELSAQKSVLRTIHSARLMVFLDGDSTLILPQSNVPDVSIILVVYNQAELTYACLTSIQECLQNSTIGIETIVLDNGSTDRTAELLPRIRGARVISNPENLHFLRGVNRAAEDAKGRYVLLLNNDAQLMPGALEAALKVFADNPDAGAVGGRIILPDGSLQEAGSIVWRDGTCVGYGRGQNPASPEFMFRRDVDYCSGAFLLTPRRLFERLGGFDERYSPAYYEEVDYCLRLWQAGYRVIFDPDVAILHFEFGSATTSSAISQQGRNLETFRKRHWYWLGGQQSSQSGDTVLARISHNRARRVLMLEDRVPHPHLGSGYPRANDILHALVKAGCQLTFFPMHPHAETWHDVRQSMPSTVEVMIGHSQADLAEFLRIRKGYYDAILVCRPHNMKVFREITDRNTSLISGVKIVYDAEAIFARREILKSALLGPPLPQARADALVAAEIALASNADMAISVSPAEAEVFRSHGIRDVCIVGFAFDVTPTRASFEDRTDILFVGAVQKEEDAPNTDSLRWFVREILPLVRSGLGFDIRVKVIGPVKAASVQAMNGDTVDLIGEIDDLAEYFGHARLLIAPTRYAAGIPHKVAQAAALGVPTVATDLIAGQLGWQPDQDILASSDPGRFAELCLQLYRDRSLWTRVRDNAMERCRANYAPAVFQAAISGIVGTIPLPPSARSAGIGDYQDWIRNIDRLTADDRKDIAGRIRGMAYRPLISVIVPLYNTPERFLRKCLESIISQLYPDWELCLVDDASPQAHVANVCREYAALDPRIRFVRRDTNGNIAAATNSAVEMATGEFAAFLDHDDELAPHALYMIAETLNEDPDFDLIFTDEDKIDEEGNRSDPWFKPDWNYDLMLSQNSVVHLAVYRRSILREIGGLRQGYDGSQDYDLTLRFIERTASARIRHIPMVLYHWRAIPGSVALDVGEKTYAYEAARRAIQDHLDRTGTGAKATAEPRLGYYRVHWPLPEEPPHVAIIIPTKDKVDLLRVAVESIRSRTSYPNYTIHVVDNGSAEEKTITYLKEAAALPNVHVLTYDKPYSFAALNNWAVAQISSPVVAFLNNDIEILAEGWLAEMVSHAVRPNVGAVGAKLYYPNNTIQHAGIVIGIGGTAGHPLSGLRKGEPGYFGWAIVTRDYSAVTGACMVMRRNVFQAMGGFDEKNFAIAFNDVDLGLRLCEAGYLVVWTPYAELYHHESASLGAAMSAKRRRQFEQECENLRRMWPGAIARDPHYNANLTVIGGDYAPAFPSRAIRPWLRPAPWLENAAD